MRKSPPIIPVEERFWNKVEPMMDDRGCWEWNGTLHAPDKRPSIKVSGKKTKLAYHVAYELTFGPIPEGLTVDHLCDNGRCINPSHLRAVTQSENVKRYIALSGAIYKDGIMIQCKRGHEMTPDNTRISLRPPLAALRQCRACIYARSKRRK